VLQQSPRESVILHKRIDIDVVNVKLKGSISTLLRQLFKGWHPRDCGPELHAKAFWLLALLITFYLNLNFDISYNGWWWW